MGFFSADSGSLVRELYVPVAPKQAWQALYDVARASHKMTDSDDFTLVVNFSTTVSAWTWGEKVSGQVIPADGGASTIRLTVVGKVGAQIMQDRRNQQLLDEVLKAVTDRLRASRA
jgi:hypothetical protein